MKHDNDNPAFPMTFDSPGYSGMTLRDWFATWYKPSSEDINLLLNLDAALNPHGDGPPKPRRRTKSEIVCFLKYKHADAMLAERET